MGALAGTSVFSFMLLAALFAAACASFLDPSFGERGVVQTRFFHDDPAGGHLERMFATVQNGRGLIACGYSRYPLNSTQIPICLSLNEDGSRGTFNPVATEYQNMAGEFRAAILEGNTLYAVGISQIWGGVSPVNTSTLVCSFDVSTGQTNFCSRSDYLEFKRSDLAVSYSSDFIAALSYTSSSSFFIQLYSKATGLLERSLFTSPTAPTGRPRALSGLTFVATTNELVVSSYFFDDGGAEMYFIRDSTDFYTVPLPLKDNRGSTSRIAIEPVTNRLFIAGSTGELSFESNSRQGTVWALRQNAGSSRYEVDTDFGENGRILLENSIPYPVFVTSVTHDNAFRIVILARRLQLRNESGDLVNNNDVIVYRRYAADGRVDASLNYGGELVSLSELSEDLFAAFTDDSFRLTSCGSQTIFLSGFDISKRRDDTLCVRWVSQVGNCSLGGPECSCATDTECDYAGQVFTVDGAVTRRARIQGKLEIAANVPITASVPFTRDAPFVTVSQGMTIQPGSSLANVVLNDGPGTYIIAQASGGISGQFAAIEAISSNPDECVGRPQYSSTTLTVTVSQCSSASRGLSTTAIVGIAVGCTVVAVGIILLAVFLHKVSVSRATMSKNQQLRRAQVDSDLNAMRNLKDNAE